MNDIEAFELFNKEYDLNFVVTVDRIYVNYTSKATGILNWTGADTLHVVFDEPQRGITSGQAVVFYDGDLVLGGGTIL